MKTAIISCVLVFLLIITSLILFTVYGQNTRQNALEDNLSITVEQALENIKINQSYTVADADEFVADFVQNFIISVDSDSDIKIEILSVDYEKGLLDVNVTETFKQPIGTKKSVSCRKTVILEEYLQDASQYYSIKFLTTRTGSEEFVDFKIYSICEGSYFIAPAVVPTKQGYTFEGWSKEMPSAENSYSPEIVDIAALDGTLVVGENLTFYAVFSENP